MQLDVDLKEKRVCKESNCTINQNGKCNFIYYCKNIVCKINKPSYKELF